MKKVSVERKEFFGCKRLCFSVGLPFREPFEQKVC